jgi:glutamyl/glutaminyl-tRNA synthetase
MKEKAELQADYENLFLIENALKILDTAKQMDSSNPSIMRIDRIEVLLSWASDISPKIQNELDSYNKDAYKIRASDILQRAKSLENLVELSLTKNRFLPNYVEFTETFNEKIDNVRDLVIKNDLDQADELVRDLFN